MKDKFKNFKEWMHEHSLEVSIVSATALYVGFVGALVVYTKKKQQEWNETVVEAVNEGKLVLPNGDGTMWIIDPSKWKKEEAS